MNPLKTMRLSSPSNLPDEVIIHILSLLPTKLAFSTTILSKIWTTSLYQSLSSLYFNDRCVRDGEAFLHFCRFVDTVTFSTKLIKSFNLTCHSRHWWNDRLTIDSWIETVKRHPLEILELHSFLTRLAPSFFKFPTLVILKLSCVNVVGDISVDLPSLKTLHLNLVSFFNKKNFLNLLYGCPVLEHLVAYIYYEDGLEDVTTGEFKSSSKLITADVNTCAVPLKAISNVKILTLKMHNRLPMINSNCTKHIFQNLIKLRLCFSNFRHLEDVVEFLQHCPKLQILSLTKFAPAEKELSINRKYPTSVPECISSHLRSCTIFYEGSEDEVQFIKYILQNAPLLEVMKINITRSLNPKPNWNHLKELSSYPRISRQCTLQLASSNNS